MARNEDETLHLCTGTEQLWQRDRWFEKFGLGPDDDGCGFTVEQVRSMPEFELQDWWRYFDDLREETLQYLHGLSEADLDRSPPGLSDPRIRTAGRLLSHLLIEQGQHLGQVAYVRGLQRGPEFTTSWNNPLNE